MSSNKHCPYHYKVILEYCGANYFGMQTQNDEAIPTIQSEVEKAIALLSPKKISAFKTAWSGRTDAGVHAMGQVGKISLSLEIPLEGLFMGLNSILPPDIRLKHIEACPETFHPIRLAKQKTYYYLFTNEKKVTNAFASSFISNVSFDLDIQKIHQALKLFEGTHNFQNFYNEGTPVKSTVRTIFEAKMNFVTQQKDHDFGFMLPKNYYMIQLTGNGFLKQMIRLIVGHLWSYARGHLSYKQLQDALDGPQKLTYKLALVAPPNGLYLAKVDY